MYKKKEPKMKGNFSSLYDFCWGPFQQTHASICFLEGWMDAMLYLARYFLVWTYCTRLKQKEVKVARLRTRSSYQTVEN